MRSSAMLLSGDVNNLWVKPLPGPLVAVTTVFAPNMRSVAFVVVAEPLLLIPLFPLPAATTSSGLARSAPLYSKMRMSGNAAAPEKLTVTVFVPAAAPKMFSP
ncbi:MAG: hypothetical protein DMG96_02315 [Acidobacteria bacterium]|nr:MAG: hypothetical protein DMG96_02315 [Acidobacteriota bacterium]